MTFKKTLQDFPGGSKMPQPIGKKLHGRTGQKVGNSYREKRKEKKEREKKDRENFNSVTTALKMCQERSKSHAKSDKMLLCRNKNLVIWTIPSSKNRLLLLNGKNDK